MNYELHPLCTYFPRMAGAEFNSLCEDIKANGLREPIVLHNGMILDGGNRYRACVDAGVVPTFRQFDGASVVAFVLSANLHRRHLTPGQQAAIVASAQDWAMAQPRGGDRRSDQSQAVDFETVEQRSAASGASRVTQMKADKVAKASPELALRVAHGEMSLPRAVAEVDAAAVLREAAKSAPHKKLTKAAKERLEKIKEAPRDSSMLAMYARLFLNALDAHGELSDVERETLARVERAISERLASEQTA